MTTLPPISSLLLPPPIPPIDADSLVALNDALKDTPVEDLRNVIRSVCLSNLEVAAVLHAALCGGDGGAVQDEDDEEDEQDEEDSNPEMTTDGSSAMAFAKGYDQEDEEEDDEDEDEEVDEEDTAHDTVPIAAVVDLTGPDSDEENTAKSTTTTITTSTGLKRKAIDPLPDRIAIPPLDKMLKTTAPKELHFKDRYKHCSNCNELFDLMATPCHPHKNGSKRAPGERERMDGDGYDGGDDTDDQDEDSDEDGNEESDDACDCIHHPGSMDADYDSGQWDDHDENCHGTIDDDFCRSEYPDGYIWTCCDQIGSAEGCRMGRHESGGILGDYGRLRGPE